MTDLVVIPLIIIVVGAIISWLIMRDLSGTGE